MQAALTNENSRAAFEALRANREEPDWLTDLRNDAMTTFAAQGLPGVRLEDWKYTDTRPLTKRNYNFNPSPVSGSVDIEAITYSSSVRIVFVDGQFDAENSCLGGLPDGVSLQSLAGDSASAIVELYIGKAVGANPHGFTALNTAFLSDGLFLHVSEGVHVEPVIEAVFVTTGGDVAPLAQPRNLVVLENGAKANLIERYIGQGADAYLANPVNEIFLKKNAHLEYCRLQGESSKAGHIGGLYVRQQADSHFIANTVSLAGMVIRNDVRVELDEPGARCHLNGLTVADGRQHVDHHTQINHNVERCVSRELYKGVLDGRSRSVFHGRIVVAKDAQQTDSEQQNQNLLLSRDAEIDTKPQLEIYADDVKCSHGATVGQLDEDSVFYLRSRGIDEDSARGLLTYAFADATLSEISESGVREYIEAEIKSRLTRAE